MCNKNIIKELAKEIFYFVFKKNKMQRQNGIVFHYYLFK